MKRVGEEVERKMERKQIPEVLVCVLSYAWECLYHRVCNGKKKKGKRGHSDECSEIITLITAMMSTARAGSDDKNTEKQPEPPIDVWLTTLQILIELSVFTLSSP